MSEEIKKEQPDAWNIHNYAISFVDLLGQRDALKNQGLLPKFHSKDEEEKFKETIRKSIGSIIKLQRRAEEMLQKAQRPRPESQPRAALSNQQQAIWDEMLKDNVISQRWSDGLVSFSNLGDQSVKCPLNSVFNIMGLIGSLCFMGLASKQPIRGAIDVAWGVEIHPGELYGAAVARTYELESSYAKYPRIVIGPQLIHFLEAHKNTQEPDVFSQNNKALAEICLSFIAKDIDGIWILHYLGQNFRKSVTKNIHIDLYKKARTFVEEQLETHQKKHNSKLAFRYSHLLSYFEAHKP